jgi:hypothetical protein
MATPLFVYTFIKSASIQFPLSLFYIVGITTLVWLVVTYITRPTDEETLKNFYRRVHPGGIGWKKIAALVPDVAGDTGYGKLFVDWIAGIVLVYSMLFGLGKLILAQATEGAAFIALGLCAAGVIYLDLSRRGFKKLVQ